MFDVNLIAALPSNQYASKPLPYTLTNDSRGNQVGYVFAMLQTLR